MRRQLPSVFALLRPESAQKLAASSAAADAYARLGLQAHDALAQSQFSGQLEKAAHVLSRMADFVRDQRDTLSDLEKVAAALIGAVQLAQDGMVGVEDVFNVARDLIKRGSADPAVALDALFAQSGGPVTADEPKEASGLDPLTSKLRELRGID
jgi:hypothetical protein